MPPARAHSAALDVLGDHDQVPAVGQHWKLPLRDDPTRRQVNWERLRAKGLYRRLKAEARARHFGEAVSYLLTNAEGELVKTTPLTGRR